MRHINELQKTYSIPAGYELIPCGEPIIQGSKVYTDRWLDMSDTHNGALIQPVNAKDFPFGYYIRPIKRPLPQPTYLGDGIYAKTDGYNVILTTGNHQDRLADNRIILEPELMIFLVQYIKDVQEAQKYFR